MNDVYLNQKRYNILVKELISGETMAIWRYLAL